MEHLPEKQRKLRLIDYLVIRARRGSVRSLDVLIQLFDPLILKICTRIFYRSHGRVTINEMREAGRQEFRKLTLLVYTPGGKAHFNRFIESRVHAELWKLYRPFNKDVPTLDEDLDLIECEPKEEFDEELAEAAKNAMQCLTEAEQKIIQDCVLGSMTGVQEAASMHLSKVRVSQLRIRALKKLKAYLIAHGYTR